MCFGEHGDLCEMKRCCSRDCGCYLSPWEPRAEQTTSESHVESDACCPWVY